jgi:hypothetical protein
MVGIQVTEARCEELSIAQPPRFEPRQKAETLDWLNKTLMPAVKARLARYEEEARRLDRSKEAGSRKQATRVEKKAEALKAYAVRILNYSKTEDLRNWISCSDTLGDLNIKPFSAADFAEDSPLAWPWMKSANRCSSATQSSRVPPSPWGARDPDRPIPGNRDGRDRVAGVVGVRRC